MTGYSPNRIENDVYNTPTSAIKSLLEREPFFSSAIWEPACSIGNISKEVEEFIQIKQLYLQICGVVMIFMEQRDLIFY
jgi:hypothetical protein